ncbi:MAG TPA: DUF58 domain-containing protein [Streptosporangiaceae bacterium]|nr:DUF58 domain-containing protein [Streptosporangiaceae bacterium]
MRGLFSSLTTRGRSFVAAGGAAIVCGLAIPEPGLVRIGALLVILPLVAALTARRSRYRLICDRRIDPPRVPVGLPTSVTVRLKNDARLRTGVLLAEDTAPYALGTRPRFVLDEMEPGGFREFTYQLRSDTRGKFAIGPLRVRVADAFGLVEISRSFKTTSTLVVTPKIVALPRAVAPSRWLGEGDGGMRTISATGEDDAAPRPYQDGDGYRRVHWRSTARYGQLMVRREEHQWRNSASVFLDTRRVAHSGSGPSATFEFAISAVASIGAHLTEEGFRARLITDSGELAPRGTFSDTLLDMLAVINTAKTSSIRQGTGELAGAGGQLIAVIAQMSAQDAAHLAGARRGNAPGMALVIATSGWSLDAAIPPDAARTAQILMSAGWRVAVVTSPSQLTTAWQQLHRPADLPVPVSNAPETSGSVAAERTVTGSTVTGSTVIASSTLAGPE